MVEADPPPPIDLESRSFPAESVGITALDSWVEEVGRRWNINERANFRARVCIAEIAANVMEHGTESGPAEFTVTLRRRGADLDVELVDTGRPFDPTAALDLPIPKSIESARIGGLGLGLLRTLASDVTYYRDGRYNRLRFHTSAVAP